MTSPKLTVLSLIITVLGCVGIAQAQQTKSPAENVPAGNAALREKAFALLDSLAGQLGTLQSAENRARLGSNIAASLWNHDETRARSLLGSVEAEIKAALDRVDEDKQTDERTRMVFLKLRMDTVERMAKHDVDLALAFFKATEMDPQTPRPYGVAEMEHALESRLAREMAARRPEIALKLGRKSLRRGFSDDLLSLLTELNKRDKQLAVGFYKEIVSHLRAAGLKPFTQEYYFAATLARRFKPPAADESSYRELIGLFIATALENRCADANDENVNEYFCQELGSLLPIMEKIDPSRVINLKQWKRSDEFEWPAEVSEDLDDLIENGTVDEVLALADKYPQLKSRISWQAIWKAEESGDVERARKIANDYIDDPVRRKEVLERLDGARNLKTISSERLAELQQALSIIPDTQERVRVLLYVANQIGDNDRKASLKLLDQTRGIVDNMKPGRKRTEAEMGLAMMYCVEKSDRGLAIMESVLPTLNDLVGAAAKLDGYDVYNMRDGEWNMSDQGSLGVLLTFLSRNASHFAWCDFDRAVSVAAQFERPELRLMAQLKLAQGILAGPPKRLATPIPQ